MEEKRKTIAKTKDRNENCVLYGKYIYIYIKQMQIVYKEMPEKTNNRMERQNNKF